MQDVRWPMFAELVKINKNECKWISDSPIPVLYTSGFASTIQIFLIKNHEINTTCVVMMSLSRDRIERRKSLF